MEGGSNFNFFNFLLCASGRGDSSGGYRGGGGLKKWGSIFFFFFYSVQGVRVLLPSPSSHFLHQLQTSITQSFIKLESFLIPSILISERVCLFVHPSQFFFTLETGDMRQETGDRRQETGDRRQETGDRRQETGNRRQET